MFCLYAIVVGLSKTMILKSETACGLPLFSSSKVMDTQVQTRIPAWIDGGYAFILFCLCYSKQ